MNFDELASRDIKDLRKLAAQYSIRTHGRQKAETIAKLIVEHIQAKPHGNELKHAAEKPQPRPLVVNTEAEIREVIAPFARKEGFQVEFPGDDTWIFRYKGSEESGHNSCLLRVIRMKAESVSKGARKPVMIDIGDGPIMAVG